MTASLSTFCFVCCLFVPTKFHFSSSVLLCPLQLVSFFKVAVFEEIFCTNFGCFCSFFFPKIYLLLFLVASQVSLNPLPLISAILAAYFCLLYLKNYHIYHFIVPSKFLFRLHCLLLVNKIHRDGLFEAIELPLFNHQKIYKAVQNHHQI